MDLYFSNQYMQQQQNSSGKQTQIIVDDYYLLYGVRVPSDLFHYMIDYIVESGEWEGEIMEFVGDDVWDFFDTEGRGKPERYEWLEGYLEENFGFHSILNERGEDVLYIGMILWSSKDIEMNLFDDEPTKFIDGETPKLPSIRNLTRADEDAIDKQYIHVLQHLRETNEYWAEKLPLIGYYWIKGSSTASS